MEHLIHFCKGYVSIQVWGYSPERFLNLCSNHGIFLWNIQKTDTGYNLCLHRKAFFALKPILKKTGTKIKIINRSGIPFLLPKIKKRWLFLAGCIIAFLFWNFSSLYIWSIEIEGNQLITDDMIEDFLLKQGVKVSVLKKNIDIEQLEQDIRKNFDQITWDSLQLEGTRLSVYIKENDYYGLDSNIPTENEDFSNGADLISELDGRVVSIITRAGEPKVKPGDTVTKGQILVSGTVPIYGDDMEVKKKQYYIADADVIIEGILTYDTSLAYHYTAKEYTGANRRVHYLQFSDQILHFPPAAQEYVYQDIITQKNQLSLMKGVGLPIYYGHDQIFEYIPVDCCYSDEEMKEQLIRSFSVFMENLKQKGVQIHAKDVKISKTNKKAALHAELAVWQKSEKKVGIIPDGE